MSVQRCDVIGEEVATPVCVTVTDQKVEEFCDLVTPRGLDQCFGRECRRGRKEIMEKVCKPEIEEVFI